MNKSRSAATLDSFDGYLKGKGFARTPQRRAVLEEVLADPAHFDIDDLASRMRSREMSVSRATVYRTITHLEKAGLIRKVDFNEAHAHYECVAGADHHEHLICSSCGSVTEFADPALERRIEGLARAHNFAMQRHTVQIFGRCGRCSEAPPPEAVSSGTPRSGVQRCDPGTGIGASHPAPRAERGVSRQSTP